MTVFNDYDPALSVQPLHPVIISWQGYSYTIQKDNSWSLQYVEVITAVGKTYTTAISTFANRASVRRLSPIYTSDDPKIVSDGWCVYLPQSHLSHLKICVKASAILCNDTSAVKRGSHLTPLAVTLKNLPPFLQEHEGLHIRIKSAWKKDLSLRLKATLEPFTFYSVEDISLFVSVIEKSDFAEMQIIWTTIPQEQNIETLFDTLPVNTFKVLKLSLDADMSGMTPNSQSDSVYRIIAKHPPTDNHPTGWLQGYTVPELRDHVRLYCALDKMLKLGFRLSAQ